MRTRNRLIHRMMIADNRIDSKLYAMVQRLKSLYPVIDSNQQGIPLLLRQIHRTAMQTVSFLKAIGNIKAARDSVATQRII